MRSIILYVCLGISVLLSLVLCIYIVKYDAECERVHLDVINRDYDTVSEAEGAKKIAAAYLGLEEDWELKENPAYDAEVIFNESGYEWIVIFSPTGSESDKERVVGIRKDYGIIAEYGSVNDALDAKTDTYLH